MVFQNYALYPHMTVRENLAFGLKLSKLPKAQIDRQVEEAAKFSNWKNCSIACRASSPAARRSAWRWAGRSSKPDVFLFDEPLSNLDAKLRASMRIRISDLHKQLKNLANRRPPSTSPTIRRKR